MTLIVILAALHAIVVAGASPENKERHRGNLLINGGFEQHKGVGTIPTGWDVIDEYFDYFGWVAPRVERRIGRIGPRSGRYLIGLDTEMLGVNTNGKQHHIPRAALYQTIGVPGHAKGTFSFYYNDHGSTALSHIAALRLAYTINHTEISTIKTPAMSDLDPTERRGRPDVWSEAYYRVSQKLPFSQTAVGDWSYASIPVVVDAGDEPVRLTLWIGIFDNQDSTEVGYYRIDDASFVRETASKPVAADPSDRRLVGRSAGSSDHRGQRPTRRIGRYEIQLERRF